VIICVRWILLLGAAAKAQLILPLVERPFAVKPPLEARAFRIDSSWWALVARMELKTWQDYAFDSHIQVQWRLYSEEGKLIAETLLSVPDTLYLLVHFHWRLPAALAAHWAYLEAFPETLPEKAHYARLYLPAPLVQAYPLQPEPWLHSPLRLMERAGKVRQISLGDSLWEVFFEPAQVDTAWPLLPYILDDHKPRWAYTPCAWYVRGDTTQVLWTCGLAGPPPKKLNLPPTHRPDAQKHFSGFKPGDRTDRGFIYAKWGPPDLRLYTTSMETWVYTRTRISFTFERKGHEWVLQRRLEYQAVWK